MHFSAIKIAANVKPCKVIVFDILFKHDLVPLTYISNTIECHISMSNNIRIHVCFFAEVILVSVKTCD